jgi:spore maturation protein CgeB
MRILYAGLKYNYGKREEGFSYEHYNIEAGFRDVAAQGLFDVEYYYPDAPGESSIAVNGVPVFPVPDAVFHVNFNESLDLPIDFAMQCITNGIPVIQWDCDSSWRFHSDIVGRRNRATHFVTTHSVAVDWYRQAGMNVIRSQWGGSPLYDFESGAEKLYDVSFIGQKHGQMPNGKFWRAEIVDAIRNAGIEIHLFGNYWDGHPNWHGYVTNFAEVPRIFNRSKICLNLSNPWHHNTMPQIKGRHFEIPQTGGFQVCTPADDLQRYFEFGKEIVVAEPTSDSIISTLRYYLEHEEERSAIAAAGRTRMLQEHQWSHRLREIFEEVGCLTS